MLHARSARKRLVNSCHLTVLALASPYRPAPGSPPAGHASNLALAVSDVGRSRQTGVTLLLAGRAPEPEPFLPRRPLLAPPAWSR
jgi:hypothetical protein